MQNKIYIAFLSSEFERLRVERANIINNLLNFHIMPIGMEHFTTSHDGNFKDIKRFIDKSDFFILLMSNTYGSVNEDNGRSWTEMEFDYAKSKNKKILVIVLDKLWENVQKMTAYEEKKTRSKPKLSDEEMCQYKFYKKVARCGFPRHVGDEISVDNILAQFFGNTDVYSDVSGWMRVTPKLSEKELRKWQSENKALDINGNWYHMHLNNEDRDYIRVGTVTIQQDFTPENYGQLSVTGFNFDVLYYDDDDCKFECDIGKQSVFTGEYTLNENGTIFGIFNANRTFTDDFIDTTVEKGIRRGIHDFKIDASDKKAVTTYIEGAFHDEAPSPKMGTLYLFRDEEERDIALFKQRTSQIFELNAKAKRALPDGFRIKKFLEERRNKK